MREVRQLIVIEPFMKSFHIAILLHLLLAVQGQPAGRWEAFTGDAMFTHQAVQSSLLNREMVKEQRSLPSAEIWKRERSETYKLSAPACSAEIGEGRERSLETPRTFLRSVELSTCFQYPFQYLSAFPFFVNPQSRTFSLFNDESVSGIGLYGFRNKMTNSNTSTADLQHNLCILVSRGHVASHPRGESSILKHLFSRTQSLQGNAIAFYIRYGDVKSEKCSQISLIQS